MKTREDMLERRRELASTERPLTRLERRELRNLTDTLDGNPLPKTSRKADRRAADIVKKMFRTP